MNLSEFMKTIQDKTWEYFGLGNAIVVDKDGNEITQVVVKVDENKIVLINN